MRKVTEQILHAFLNRKQKKIGNTFCDGDSVYLYGNKIVTRNRVSGVVFIRNAGWNTPTTRERLNAFTSKRVQNKDYRLMLDGKPWSGDWTEA